MSRHEPVTQPIICIHNIIGSSCRLIQNTVRCSAVKFYYAR